MRRDCAILRGSWSRRGGSLARRKHEHGGIITSWLLQIVVLLGVLAFIAYEALSIGLTAVSLDDNAREVARAARDAYRAEASLEQAEESAREVADLHQAVIVSLEEDGDELSVTLEKQAPTLLIHRIGPLEGLTVSTQTTRIRVQP